MNRMVSERGIVLSYVKDGAVIMDGLAGFHPILR